MNRRIALFLALALILGGVGIARAGSLYTADLTGAAEVPPNGSTATGHANFYLSADETNLHVKLTVTGFTNTITDSHIHKGAVGVSGPVVFGIGPFTTSIEADWALGAADVADLKAGLLYVNVHTNVFPGGEIRGQIGSGISYSLVANLSGANEVPPNASTRTGVGDVTLLADGSILHIDCTASGFPAGGITDSHIHVGAVGVSGPVVFAIGPFNNRIAKDFSPTSAQVNDLLAGNYYVNYHSAAFPGGEIRGQLVMDARTSVPPEPLGTHLLFEVAPNPMQQSTNFSFGLPAGTAGRVEIFSAAGQSLNEFGANAAEGAITWNGRDRAGQAVPSGTYFARLTTGRASRTVHVTVIR